MFEELDPMFLNQNMRQKNDKEWCNILDRMSIGKLTEHDLTVLKLRIRTEEELNEINPDMWLFPYSKRSCTS